jgi:LPXTG-motif cell wall-anchored protein
MKKFTSSFITVMLVVLFTSVAFAGPVDWFMDKIGYTPTYVYESQKTETAKALEAAKVATEATKVATSAAASAAATAKFQGTVISYGGIAILGLGGFAYLRRKKIANAILEEKKAKPVVEKLPERELEFGEKPTIAL